MQNQLTPLKQMLLTIMLVATLASSASDIKDSSDHDLITRYPGSVIKAYTQSEYDTYQIPMSVPFRVTSKEYSSEMVKTIQGKITRIVYASSKGSSDLQIHQNYLNAFAKPNFDILRQCHSGKCQASAKIHAYFLKQKRVSYHDKGQAFFIVARYQPKDGAPVYIVILNGPTNRGNSHIIVDVIETKNIELGKVTTNVDALLDSLAQTGSAQIYDIFFDTGQAVIKPESQSALEAIAQVLVARPQMDLYIVGHTDDTGTLATNNKLAKDRAAAITKYLVNNLQIKKNRLFAAGAGPYAPIASNDTEEGRAKNRRVEIVKRLTK